MQVRIKTDLTVEPVTVAEAKAWCRVTGNAEDSIFTLLIASARKSLEKYCSASFGEKTIHVTWVDPKEYEFELPYGPVISVDKIYYIDAEGTETEQVLNTDYNVYGDQAALIKVATHWRSGITDGESIRIEYTAGYGNASTEPLPDDLKMAILMQVATDYLFRENIATSGYTNLSNESKSKAAFYRRKLWF